MNIPIASMFDTFARCGVNVLQIHHNFAFRNAMIPRWSGKEHPAKSGRKSCDGRVTVPEACLTSRLNVGCALPWTSLNSLRLEDADRSRESSTERTTERSSLGAPGRYPEGFRIRSFWWIRMILPRWWIHCWVLFEMYGKIFCWCIVAHG